MRSRLLIGMMAGCLVFIGGLVCQVDASELTVEITPYAWLAGIDADVTVGSRKGSIDVGFSDLVDYVDFAGGLLLTVDKNRWVGWFQGDYMDLNSDNKVTKFDELGDLETQMTILEAAGGYQFDNPLMKGAIVDVLLGARYTKMENTFKSASGITSQKSKELADPMLVMRPWFPISKKWAFNPTLGIGGGGDSDLIYELQPQFQYQFTDNLALRAGYRRLYYKVKDNNHEFDGAFHGLLVGLGMKF